MPITIIQCNENYQSLYFPSVPDCLLASAQGEVEIGLIKEGNPSRSAFSFPLDSLPLGEIVKRVRVRFYVIEAGGENHLLDISPYAGDGKTEPPNDCYVNYLYCKMGTPYIDDSTAMRQTGWTDWLDLGSQACIDVFNAKQMVNKFFLGFAEEGDDDTYGTVCAAQTPEPCLHYIELEITYGEEGYSYSNGLTSIQVVR